MFILDKYVARQVLMATLMVIVIIVGLDLIFSTLDEFNQLHHEYQAFEAFSFVSMRIPRRVYEFLPLACLIGCMAGLGGLASNSELTVMRASGISVNRIGFALLKPIAFLMLLNLVLSELVIPELEPIAQNFKAEKKGRQDIMSNRGRGYWHREGNLFMRFASISRQGEIIGINQFEFGEDFELLKIRRAQRAVSVEGGWQLKDVSQTNFVDGKHYDQVKMGDVFWETDLTSDSLSLSMLSPQDMSLHRLYLYVNYLDDQGINGKQYELAMWSKTLQPFSAFALVLLGMSFIFGPLRSATAGYRIFSGILAGLIYKYTQDMLTPISLVSGLPTLWANLLPIVLCVSLAFYLLRRE